MGSELYDLEYAVIGCMIRYPDKIGPILAELRPEDFQQLPTQGLFVAIRTLFFQGAEVNRFTVLAEAGSEYNDALGMALLAAAGDPAYHVRKLRDASQLLSLQRAASDLEISEDLEHASAAVAKINALSVSKRGRQVVSLGDAVQQYVDDIGKKLPEYIKLGIPTLDDTVYLRRGNLFVLGGYASSGKTLMALQFAKHIARRYKVGFFSFETMPADFAIRALATESKITNRRLLHQQLTPADTEAVMSAAKGLAALHLDIIPATGYTVADIQAMTLSNRYDVIFVDYLQLIQDHGASRYEKITQISQDLHNLALGRNVLVVALSQLSRAEKSKSGKPMPPTMASLRESGQIEQDADVIALMWPEDPDDNSSDRIFKVSKNKNGEKLKLSLAFDGPTQTMVVRDRPRDYRPARIAQAAGTDFVLLPPQDPAQEQLPF